MILIEFEASAHLQPDETTRRANHLIDRESDVRITDYEKAGTLRDVAISLTREEAEDLAIYLGAMLKRPQVNAIHLSEITGGRIDKEIRFDLAEA